MPCTTRSKARKAREKCHLLALPAELRTRIYEYVLVESPCVSKTFESWTEACVPFQPPLARTNHEVRRECLPIYYGQNVFRLRLLYPRRDDHRQNCILWLKAIGENVRLIRRVELNLCPNHSDIFVIEAYPGQPVRYENVETDGLEGACFVAQLLNGTWPDVNRRGYDTMESLAAKVGISGFGAEEYTTVIKIFNW